MKQLKIEMWPIDKPIDYPQNAKKHTKEQIEALAKVIREQGFDQPLVLDAEGVIIKGHGRRKAARLAGLTEVPVIKRDDLTPEQVRVARLTDNKVAALTDIDTAALRLELEEVNIDLLRGIFSDKELEFSTIDLGELNADPFIDDLDKAVEKQTAETAEKVEELKGAQVSVAKALGFKTIAGRDEIYVSRLMAQIELETGKTGGEALGEYARKMAGDVSKD